MDTILALEQSGYTVHLPLSSLFSGDRNPYFGGVHAIALEKGRWRGAADLRRDGEVAEARR
jgi:gamma-glutamyltranspeptidase/glutathione hydrolase